MTAEWVMAEPRHAGPDLGDRVVSPDDPPSAAIESLRLHAPATDPPAVLPPVLRDYPNLRRLTLGPAAGRALVASITAEAIPPTVTTLGIFTAGQATTWPSGVTLPQVTALRADGPLMLGRDAFPNLRAVSIRPARHLQNLDELLTLPGLRELHLISAPAGVLDRIGDRPLTGLGLLGGRLATLDGIERLTGLTALRLHNLPALRSIAALAGLPIETLQIRYCRAITDRVRGAELPALRTLQIVACGDLALS